MGLHGIQTDSLNCKTNDLRSQFAEDVRKGLSQPLKTLPSRYLYDDAGSRLFQDIMALPEYYPTRCEAEILQAQAEQILKTFVRDTGSEKFNIIELGAGDGSKTVFLLRQAMRRQMLNEYVAVDISREALASLSERLEDELANLPMRTLERDYIEALESLTGESKVPSLIFFMGSNIGNMTRAESDEFLLRLRRALKPGDGLLTGFDLKKEVSVLTAAYNDSAGVTAAFNINLLKRINSELCANFLIENFAHYGPFNPSIGAMESYLISQKDQDVFIAALGETIHFNDQEAIHMEYSFKYSRADIKDMAAASGFSIIETFTDRAGYFVDSLWKVPATSLPPVTSLHH